MDRRNFLRLSLGAALLPIFPSIAYGSNSFGKIVVSYHDAMRRMTEEFSVTEGQVFDGEFIEPLMMTADQACTVTGCRAEFPFGGQTKSLDLLSQHAGRTWAMNVGDTVTFQFHLPLVTGV